ncbi:DoxX family protein [Marivirga sp.]|uniref:DoxX family protein n=1 Tax=Marivirga sp. TaxID=2018662 RepID=UPI0025DFFAF5|nr:DoxX family protein [Marivirga sp.]
MKIKMSLIANIGRYLFAIPMVIFGVFHFVNTRTLQNVVPSFIPGQTLWVYLTGAALIAAGISILIKKQVQLISNLLALMLLVFALFVHLPLAIEGDQLASSSLLKDIALAGGALILGNYFKTN